MSREERSWGSVAQSLFGRYVTGEELQNAWWLVAAIGQIAQVNPAELEFSCRYPKDGYALNLTHLKRRADRRFLDLEPEQFAVRVLAHLGIVPGSGIGRVELEKEPGEIAYRTLDLLKSWNWQRPADTSKYGEDVPPPLSA